MRYRALYKTDDPMIQFREETVEGMVFVGVSENWPTRLLFLPPDKVEFKGNWNGGFVQNFNGGLSLSTENLFCIQAFDD